MTRAEVNEIVENANRELEKAGKMFRVKTINLIEHDCTHCDNVVMLEQNSCAVPVCDECLTKVHNYEYY